MHVWYKKADDEFSHLSIFLCSDEGEIKKQFPSDAIFFFTRRKMSFSAHSVVPGIFLSLNGRKENGKKFFLFFKKESM